MKNHKSIKKFISLILTVAFLIANITVPSAYAEGTVVLSDSGYSELDLSLTKTIYNGIGQTGQVKAAVIQEKDVSMYATPYYSNTSSTDSEKYYAVKVDKDTHAYLVKSGTAKKTFTARPQRVMLSASQLVFTSDNTNVATVNSDGVITITGYGIANILVTYNGGTPADSSDDVSGAVTIFASQPDGNIITIDNTLQWTDANHSALEMRINKITDASLSDIYEAGSLRFSPVNLTSAFDPIGNDSSPLSIQVTGNSNLTTRNNYVSADTLAGGDASLIAQEYAANSRVMIQGWYYESGKGASNDTVYPKISFGYCGTTDISSSVNDGRRAWQLGNKKGGYYRIWGGDANTYSSAANNTFFKKDTTPSGVSTTSASATKTLSGFDTAIPATKGWHQFALTVEPSLINPGTDYALTKVYLDGKLLTSQDIYIGDIEIGKRRVYIFLPKLAESTGYSSDTAGGGNDYMHYKGLTIARFDNSQTIVDSIPADGAKNVPLYQTIRVKLGQPVETIKPSDVTLNGVNVSDVKLDESKTVLTINPGKLLPDKQYVLYAAGDRVVFRTTSDEGTTNLIDDMKTHGYNVTEARSLDFADASKSAEEYGIGFLRHCANLNVTVSDGIATFEEGKRSSQSESGKNALILRNVTGYDSKADRIVISYKVKLNVPSSYAGDSEYAFASTTDHTGGIGIPVIAKKTTSRPYSPVTRNALAGANSTAGSIPTLQTTGGQVAHTSLLSKNTGTDTVNAYNLNGGKLVNCRLPQTSFSVWRQIVYVVDMDTTGQNAPTWYFVDVDRASRNLNSKAAIYKLDAPASYGAGYTWVDSLYIPMSRASASLSLPTSLSIKDVEIYSLSLDPYSQIENEISVTDSASSVVVYADELSGKTVDVTLKGSIGAESTVIFAAYNNTNGNLRLENVKSVKTSEVSSSITMKNFNLPEGENVQLCVFVWDSFADKKSYEMKYVYTLTK